MLQTQLIYCGDNLDQLRHLPDESIHLIYIDPPFNSNRNYEVFWGDVKKSAPLRIASEPSKTTSTGCAHASANYIAS